MAILPALGLSFLAVLLSAAVALADGPGNTSLKLDLAKSASAPTAVILHALLLDGAGKPVANGKIVFTSPARFFLGATSDMVIAEGVTGKDGVAEAEFDARDTGWLAVNADYRGNEQVASAKASSQILVEAVSEPYRQEAGVKLPGFNAAPLSDSAHETVGGPSGFARLWPAMSAWPIALVLAIVWFLYGLAVVQLVRIAQAGARDVDYALGRGVYRTIGGGAPDSRRDNNGSQGGRP